LIALILTGAAVIVAAPPAQGQAFNRLVIVHDIVRGSVNVPAAQAAGRVCVWSGRFQRNEEVVWRIKVMDPTTGRFLDASALKDVEVKIGSGQEVKARYGPHPRGTPTDNFWTAAWTIPANYPSGAVPYTISATHNDGRTGLAVVFNVDLSALTVIDGAVPVVPRN
jgi:hypothetical protein